MQLLLALLIYPGLALALVLALMFRLVVEDSVLPHFGRVQLASAEGLTSIVSVLLAALGLALLPWPLHPAADWSWIGTPMLLWAVFEGAFLLPLLSALRSPSPMVARAASREAQMSVAGRTLIWLALGLSLWQDGTWRLANAPGHVLLLLAGLLAIPVAISIGPFAPERFFGVASADEGLDQGTAALSHVARTVRGVVLLAALIVAALPLSQMQPVIALVVAMALLLVVALLLRQLSVALPRFTLPSALRWCWTWSLPVLVVAAVYLAVVP